jgi:hypothetical protein
VVVLTDSFISHRRPLDAGSSITMEMIVKRNVSVNQIICLSSRQPHPILRVLKPQSQPESCDASSLLAHPHDDDDRVLIFRDNSNKKVTPCLLLKENNEKEKNRTNEYVCMYVLPLSPSCFTCLTKGNKIEQIEQ